LIYQKSTSLVFSFRVISFNILKRLAQRPGQPTVHGPIGWRCPGSRMRLYMPW